MQRSGVKSADDYCAVSSSAEHGEGPAAHRKAYTMASMRKPPMSTGS